MVRATEALEIRAGASKRNGRLKGLGLRAFLVSCRLGTKGFGGSPTSFFHADPRKRRGGVVEGGGTRRGWTLRVCLPELGLACIPQGYENNRASHRLWVWADEMQEL